MTNPILTRDTIINIAKQYKVNDEYVFYGNIKSFIEKKDDTYCRVTLDRKINLTNGNVISFDSFVYSEYYPIYNISDDFRSFDIMCDYLGDESTEVIDSGNIYTDDAIIANVKNYPALIIDTGKSFFEQSNVNNVRFVSNEVLFTMIDIVSNYKDKSKKKALSNAKANVWSMSMNILQNTFKSGNRFDLYESDLLEDVLNKNDNCVIFFTRIEMTAN